MGGAGRQAAVRSVRRALGFQAAAAGQLCEQHFPYLIARSFVLFNKHFSLLKHSVDCGSKLPIDVLGSEPNTCSVVKSTNFYDQK